MQRKEILRNQIERTRRKLDFALASGSDVKNYYQISVELDEMIEKYIDLCEEEKVEKKISCL
ncbi:MAG: Spo0E family sporulation regulatory protein-aspartic acid phosphatase [Lachnospiraceae bacterium]|nr:Spo0E family sporulation regulatory protein-aspartic acid phosphatase [Lachnospiraceae bacterium]